MTMIGGIDNLLAPVLASNLVLIFYFLAKSATQIKFAISKLGKQSLILLLLIFICSLYIRSYMIPHQHFMWIDESWNLEAAKNFLMRGKPELCTYVGADELKCDFYPKPAGFPYIISRFLMLFGTSEYTGINVSVLFGSLSSILVFFIARRLTGDNRIGLLSALAFTLMPAHLYWSGSSETNVTSVFLNLASISVFLAFLKSEKWILYLLGISLLSLSIQIVPTDGLLIPLVIILFLLFGKNKTQKLRNPRFWLGMVLLIILTAPHFLYMYQVIYQTQEYLCEGDVCHEGMLTLAQVSKNWSGWGIPQFIDRMQIPVLIGFFIVIGMAYSLRRNQLFLSLASWFLLFYIVNMAYWDPQNRKFLNVLPPLSIFLGIGISRTIDSLVDKFRLNRKIILTVFFMLIVLSFKSGVVRVMNGSSSINVAQTMIPAYVREMPEESYLIAEWPTVFLSTTNIRGMRTSDALDNPGMVNDLLAGGASVYFLEDMYCRPPSYERALDNCRRFMSEYDTERYLEINHLNVTFYIHRVV